MKKIKKIVLTGGPCAGKTTALSKITSKMTQRGWKVLIIPETATELILNGIFPLKESLATVDFQRAVIQKQIYKEKVYLDIAKRLKEEKVLIICDRGIMDSKAYISDEDFKLLLKEEGITEIDCLNRYDFVIHLVTAAIGAEKYYTTINNNARTETKEQAIEVDNKTMNCWLGHAHLKVVTNDNKNFDEKIREVLNTVSFAVGEPIPLEIERKYLVKYPDITKIPIKYCITKITQTYLKSEELIERRIRKISTDYGSVYTKATKQYITFTKRIEKEENISKEEYEKLLEQRDENVRQIVKNRVCFIYDNQYFELDLYNFSNSKSILEVELTDENQNVKIPEFIEVIADVTEDKRYSNHFIGQYNKL